MFSTKLKLLAREMLFRFYCRHRQGEKPNIMLYCSRRGGSTWLLNTIAAHPGMRYVGRPFMTVLQSRWAGKVPSLSAAAEYDGERQMRQIIHFEGQDEKQFIEVARNIIESRWHVYPTINFRASYFNRVTDRVIFQMTSGLPMIRWFEKNFNVATVYLIRHPIPNALSIMDKAWEPECFEFLENRFFVETYLTERQIELARKIEGGDCLLSRHVLDWCLKHLVPLRELAEASKTGNELDWKCVCYEDLVQRPGDVIKYLADGLDLDDLDSMMQQVQAPSRTVTQSTAGRVNDKSYLVSRWRQKIDPDKEKSLFEILDQFGVDTYRVGQDDPTSERFLCPGQNMSVEKS